MNTQQRKEHTVYFARQWLEKVLTQCRQVKGMLKHFRREGHLNYRYTSLKMDNEEIKKIQA